MNIDERANAKHVAFLQGGMYDGERVELGQVLPRVIRRPLYTEKQAAELGGTGFLDLREDPFVEYHLDVRTRPSGCVFYVLKGAGS